MIGLCNPTRAFMLTGLVAGAGMAIIATGGIVAIALGAGALAGATTYAAISGAQMLWRWIIAPSKTQLDTQKWRSIAEPVRDPLFLEDKTIVTLPKGAYKVKEKIHAR